MSKYNDEDLITTSLRYTINVSKKTTIFLLIMIYNGVIGLIFSIWGSFHYKSGLFLIIAILIGILITTTTLLGFKDYKGDHKHFRLFIVISSVLSLFTLFISADILLEINNYLGMFIPFGIGIIELVFLCYNFVGGQKEDRNILLKDRMVVAKRKENRLVKEEDNK